jgi:hypothetical protein
MRPQNIAARPSLPRLQIVVSTVPAERIQAGIQTQRLIVARMDYNRPDLVLSLCQAGARVQLQLLRASGDLGTSARIRPSSTYSFWGQFGNCDQPVISWAASELSLPLRVSPP